MNKNKILETINLKKFFLMFVISFCISGNNVFASDNVLQAIQVNGVKDSYNIILKSDDVADLKKTIQAPNKMVLTLKGIRASKTINTIYNNTSSVDSVVVEPMSEDSIKILIQAANVGSAEIHFDSLKTPLGVLGNSGNQTKITNELVLNKPIDSYKPVYDNSVNEEETGFSLSKVVGPIAKPLKNVLKDEKTSWMITFGLFSIFLLNGMKLFKGKDSDIKVGLTQSLKEREIELYRGLGKNSELNRTALNPNRGAISQTLGGTNYGLRAYQQEARNPYVSSEIQRPRPAVAPSVNLQQIAKSANLKPQAQNNQNLMQNTIQNNTKTVMQKAAPTNAVSNKTANIDSMKFLESMTKIYEKNGRTDLAQGLKTNMKKAKMNLA